MGVDILILTIYFICVLYVLYQMALSVERQLEDQFKIVLEEEDLQKAVNYQLQQQTIYRAQAGIKTEKATKALEITFLGEDDQAIGVIAVQILPMGKRPIEPPINHLNLSLLNTLPDQQVFVQWDHSSISVYGGIAQRVVRTVPGQPIDLLQPQVMTTVNPDQAMNAAITAEGQFTRPDNQIALSAPALIDLEKIPKLKEPLRTYSLRIIIWVRSMMSPDRPAVQLMLPFTFRIEVLPDHVALPVLSWLLNANVFSRPSQKSR